jgi:CspA family cold shock protein
MFPARRPIPVEISMATGIVKFYNASKGFGLIAPDLGGPALFANSADFKSGVKKLMARERVEYDVREAADGASAANIRVLAG